MYAQLAVGAITVQSKPKSGLPVAVAQHAHRPSRSQALPLAVPELAPTLGLLRASLLACLLA